MKYEVTSILGPLALWLVFQGSLFRTDKSTNEATFFRTKQNRNVKLEFGFVKNESKISVKWIIGLKKFVSFMLYLNKSTSFQNETKPKFEKFNLDSLKTDTKFR